MLAHLEAGKPLTDWTGRAPAELDPLTTKPLIALDNGPGGIDLQLEAELAELSDEEAAAFRDGRSALDEVVRRLKDALGLITFFTAGEKETRAWTLRDGQTALDAAATIHSDIARGFIRCEVIRWNDLRRRRLARRGVEAGHAAARGQDVRRPGRRRAQHPLQRLSSRARRGRGAARRQPAAIRAAPPSATSPPAVRTGRALVQDRAREQNRRRADRAR